MACAQFIVGARGCAGEWGNFNIINTMLKNNAGFDLKQLFIGSEGTLGGITGAVLRLHEAQLHKNSALCTARLCISVQHVATNASDAGRRPIGI